MVPHNKYIPRQNKNLKFNNIKIRKRKKLRKNKFTLSEKDMMLFNIEYEKHIEERYFHDVVASQYDN